jgi:hypothetical protein
MQLQTEQRADCPLDAIVLLQSVASTMSGSGGIGFVIDATTVLLLLLVLALLGGVWRWSRSRERR